MLSVECRAPSAEFAVLSSQLNDTRNPRYPPGNWELGTGNWELATGNWERGTDNSALFPEALLLQGREVMFFAGWWGIARVLIVGVLAYAALIAMLRVSGKRTLSKLNAFDLVVTVALGSTFASVLLSKDVPLLEGLAAFIVLIVGQYVITFLSVRFPRARNLVKNRPRLLVYRGKVLKDAIREERITEEEIRAVARGSGASNLEDVGAMILETDASVHVMKDEPFSLLEGVKGFPPVESGR